MSPPLGDPRVRFMKKVVFPEDGVGCWLYAGTIYPNGYGAFSVRVGGPDEWGKVYAHRFSYEMFVGEIPEGLDIDHLCRTRHCVNPSHLEPVTRQENLRRGINANREKTHCPRGHEYTTENTYLGRNGKGRPGRKCVACTRERDKQRWGKKAA